LPAKYKLIAAALALAATVQPATAQAPNAQADEIVVTAQRTGIPVWRVNSPTTTVVLIGAINGVTKDTKWDPARADRDVAQGRPGDVPSMTQLSGSPFALIGALAKWRKQATLPKGQSLQQMLPPEQFQRLVALQKEDC
jgi:hypothetical protein